MKHYLPLISLWLSITTINAQVVINEVQAKPAPSTTAHVDQSMAHTTPNYGREFIELYNTSCISVDIGCWVIATESWGTSTRDGSYRIPAGTILGPHSYYSIGGALAGATVDLSALLIASDPHISTGSSSRWYIENGDAYAALFDDTGTPIDAVFWTTSSGQSSKWATDGDLDDPVSQIPSPPGCPAIGSFADPSDANIAAVVEYAGQVPATGASLARIQDGGTWTNTGTPSVSAPNDVFDPCAILPITLLSFDGVKIENHNVLTWATAAEINNDYFDLERSYDAQNFTHLKTISGSGNSDNTIHYLENDYEFDISYSISYYRLKQVDFNGNHTYSNIVALKNILQNQEINIFPNPMINHITIISNSQESIFYQLFSVEGKLVLQGNFTSKKILDISNLSKGAYYITATSQKEVFQKKLIKK